MSTPTLCARLAAPLAALLLATAAQAAPVTNPFVFDEFGGPDSAAMSGGLLFLPGFGGGWIGVLQGNGPGAPTFDTLTFFSAEDNGLGGSDINGEFTFIFRDVDGLTPDDDGLTGTLTGTLSADTGLVSVNYAITGGSGLFAGFTGSGNSMFSYDSSGFEPFSYAGSGALLLQGPAVVSAPGTLALAALGLLGVAGLRRAAPCARPAVHGGAKGFSTP